MRRMIAEFYLLEKVTTPTLVSNDLSFFGVLSFCKCLEDIPKFILVMIGDTKYNIHIDFQNVTLGQLLSSDIAPRLDWDGEVPMQHWQEEVSRL